MKRDIYQLLRFLVVGGVNTGIGYMIIFGGMYILNLSPEVSNVLGYGFGLLVAYTLHRNFTFRSKGHHSEEFMGFLVVFAIAFGLNFVTLYVSVRQLGIHEGVSQVISGAVYILSSYILNSRLVFLTNESEIHKLGKL
ncbi:MAG: GtrA family protein [Candidatus Competibacteraceae bacterium]